MNLLNRKWAQVGNKHKTMWSIRYLGSMYLDLVAHKILICLTISENTKVTDDNKENSNVNIKYDFEKAKLNYQKLREQHIEITKGLDQIISKLILLVQQDRLN